MSDYAQDMADELLAWQKWAGIICSRDGCEAQSVGEWDTCPDHFYEDDPD